MQFFRGTRGSLFFFSFFSNRATESGQGDRIFNIPEEAGGRAAENDWEILPDGKHAAQPVFVCGLRQAAAPSPIPLLLRRRPLCVAWPRKRNGKTWARDKITSAPRRTRARMRPDIKIYYPRTCRSSSMNPFSPLTSPLSWHSETC